MIKESTGFLPEKSISLGTRQLFYRLFKPESKVVKGTLLILHGMQEHSGRYVDFAKYVSEKGYVVLCYDHLGHGKSVTDESELGFFQLGNPAQQLVEDAEYMLRHLQRMYPRSPSFVLGHSMGSFVLRLLLQQTDDMIDGAIVVGTGGANTAASLALPLLRLLNKWKPRKRSKFVNSMFENMNNRKFKNEPGATSTSWLSLSTANRAAFDADPLNGVPFSNNGFYALLTLNTNATKRNWMKMIHKTQPLLFISGQNDPIGNFGKGVRGTADNLRKNGFIDVKIKLYKNMRHEILNEDIKHKVYDDIIKWITEHRKL